mgnify:CR=1 FL=1
MIVYEQSANKLNAILGIKILSVYLIGQSLIKRLFYQMQNFPPFRDLINLLEELIFEQIKKYIKQKLCQF